MYSVFSQGLTNYDITPMLQVFGLDLAAALGIACDPAPVFDAAGHVLNPCLDPVAFGINWSYPEPVTTGLVIARLRASASSPSSRRSLQLVAAAG